LSTGRLLMRIKAYEREEAWAPRYVAGDLEATHHQAQQHHSNATIWAQRADAPGTSPADAATLRAKAAEAQAAAAATQRITELEAEDTARSVWFVATAATRDAAARARVTLGLRGVSLDDPADRTTAQEWRALHHADQAAEDLHREIHDDTDLTDEHLPTEFLPIPDEHLTETAIPDIREISTPDVSEHTDPTIPHRLPTVEETAAIVDRYRTALAEIEARKQYERAHEAVEALRWAQPLEHDDELLVSE
jgi:hypothetical protein